VLNIFSTAGASILGIGLVLPVIYLTYSCFAGAKASSNPWLLPGLEWRTASPPPTENFSETPIVTWEAYEFGEESGLGVGEAPTKRTVEEI